MKFGTGIPGLVKMPSTAEPWHDHITHQDIVRIAQKADGLGYDSISVPDHVIALKEELGYLGPRWPDAISTVAFLAGATKRIGIQNSVLVLPYYNPVICAKAFATMDYLSGGRVTLSVGVGHLERESAILNVPYSERGAMTDEYLRAIKELWTSDAPTFHGRFVQFEDIAFEPKPVQKPHPPILIGGNSRRAVRRAAELGDGWVPFMLKPDEIRDRMDYLHEQPAYQGRTRPFDISLPVTPYRLKESGYRQQDDATSSQSKDALIDAIGKVRELGATMAGASFIRRPSSVDEHLEQLEWFASEVMPAFKD